MEDAGIRPLLPIPKHDPQMILEAGEIGRPAAAGTEPCVSHRRCWLCQHAVRQGVGFSSLPLSDQSSFELWL